MKQKKYLALYEKWLKAGMIDPIHPGNYNGMCGLFDGDDLFSLFRPTDKDLSELLHEGKCTAWWGSDMSSQEAASFEGWSSFTPLRQTIVLFLAAMNSEL